jgi:hypothetical protein
MMVFYDLLQDGLKRYCFLIRHYHGGTLVLNLRPIIESTIVGAGNLIANIIGVEPFASVSFNIRYTSSYGKINYPVSLASLSATASIIGVLSYCQKTYLTKENALRYLSSPSFDFYIFLLVYSSFLSSAYTVLLIGVVAFTFFTIISCSIISSERLSGFFSWLSILTWI